MELAAGERCEVGKTWPTCEFSRRQETAALPNTSERSKPARTNRRVKLSTGVVGPLRAWKLPLGTCTKNRRVTSTIIMKSNLACLAIIVSKLPSAATGAQSVVSLTSSEANSRAFDRPGIIPNQGSAGDHKIYPNPALAKEHNGTPPSANVFAKILLDRGANLVETIEDRQTSLPLRSTLLFFRSPDHAR